jgi:hypothetical protein
MTPCTLVGKKTIDRALRRTCGPKTEEIIRDCGRMHNEELHNLYSESVGGRGEMVGNRSA